MKGRRITSQYSTSEQDTDSSSNISIPPSRQVKRNPQQNAPQQNAQRKWNPPPSNKNDYNRCFPGSYYEEEERNRNDRNRYQSQTTNNNVRGNSVYDGYEGRNQVYDSNMNRNFQNPNTNYMERKRIQVRPEINERMQLSYNNQGRNRRDIKYDYYETDPLTQNPNEILKRAATVPTPADKSSLFVPNTRPNVEQTRRAGRPPLVLDPYLEMEEKAHLDQYVRRNVPKFKQSTDSTDSIDDIRDMYYNLMRDYKGYRSDNMAPRGRDMYVYEETKDKNASPFRNYDTDHQDKRVRSCNAISTSTIKQDDVDYMRRILPSPYEKRYTLCIKPTYKDPEYEEVIKTKLGKNKLKIKVRGNIDFNVNE